VTIDKRLLFIILATSRVGLGILTATVTAVLELLTGQSAIAVVTVPHCRPLPPPAAAAMATDAPGGGASVDLSKVGLSASEAEVLQEGLVELSRAKPANPLRWLGQWLKENNPNFAARAEGEEAGAN
jgi:hypothetical protein